MAAFLPWQRSRLLLYVFRGLNGVHWCYGLQARGAAKTALSIEGFNRIVTSTAAPINTGRSESFRVGLTTAFNIYVCTCGWAG
jgi:hypothetical protein